VVAMNDFAKCGGGPVPSLLDEKRIFEVRRAGHGTRGGNWEMSELSGSAD
jgi:hypothetical protein